MMRVNMVHEVERHVVIDNNGLRRHIKTFEKNGNLYVGPISAMFDRTYVMKDKNRLEFTSKLDNQQSELVHIEILLNKMDEHTHYSYFTRESMTNILVGLGYNKEDFTLKDKIYTASVEMFIEYGFNSMNFCLDRRGDIWVHYKGYEEQKQYRNITNALTQEKMKLFEEDFKKMVRYVRYVETGGDDKLRCFALKSINITKLYAWLNDQHILHSVDYVSDIYHATLRELDFHEEVKEDPFVKVIATSNGFKLKETMLAGNI